MSAAAETAADTVADTAADTTDLFDVSDLAFADYDFATPTSLDAERLARRIRRNATNALKALNRAPLASTATGWRPGGGGGSKQRAPRPPPVDVLAHVFPVDPLVAQFDPHAVLRVTRAVDEVLGKVAHDDIVEEFPSLDGADRAVLMAGYASILAGLQDTAMRRVYGCSPPDVSSRLLQPGDVVPSYFANVGGESMWRRKQLSVYGLRNLITYGPVIYSQLRAKAFVGKPTDYTENDGLGLMRRMTGNVVDLDTTVLRCSCPATLAAINASNKHKGLPVFKSTDAFADSEQAREIAAHSAEHLLQEFSRKLGLETVQQRVNRKVDWRELDSSKPVPCARDNSSRGQWPLWQYINCGVNSFHANVPNFADVAGALLRAPYHCVRAWAWIHAAFPEGPELDRRRADFFEHCVVDSCFNMKWRAIEEFIGALAEEGSVVHVLQRLQMRHQSEFTEELFAADEAENTRRREIELMWALAVKAGAAGRDAAGVVRALTENDVKAWVENPAIKI